MRLTLLGTGTPSPSLDRQSSGYLLEVGSSVVVFDHGPGAHHRLIESGRRAVEVTHAFFSHLHYDHWLDYPRLVLQRWDQGAGRVPELEVYGPTPLARLSDLLFASDGVYGLDIRARIEHPSSLDVFAARGGSLPRLPPAPRVAEVHAGSVATGPDWVVTVGHAAHVQPQLECLAFRVDGDDGSICYSGDSGVCESMASLARGCDVLVHMTHYLSGSAAADAYRDVCGNHRDVADLAREAGVKTLVLTHLPPEIDRPEVRARILDESRLRFHGRVVLGEDLLSVAIDRSGLVVEPPRGR